MRSWANEEVWTGRVFHIGTRHSRSGKPRRVETRVGRRECRVAAAIDTGEGRPNNAAMSNPGKPEVVRRVKSYSAASGYVYQYQFHGVNASEKAHAAGNEYVYYVSADRKTMFPIRVTIRREALDRWTKQTGRALTGTEEYELAKMRLFEAFDSVEDFSTARPELTVDETNVDELLARLDL